ncbi:Beta-glucosidase BoGH3B [Carex littledalei]|uniref:Beta-glucosidase BoGH3B n=1 Tax=Carex littledalei TaxID=544730 RepID=A0A833QJ24_9POAL|nr:Beta-glucosidase BoGH3B [Carex littledalei]
MEVWQKFVSFVVFLLCCSALTEAAGYVKYKDPKIPIKARVEDLLRRMTLAEKIGQMSQIERLNATSDVLKNYFIGSVLSGGGSTPSPLATAKTWTKTINKMQKAALSTRLGIPIIYGIDAVHGHNNVYKATIFPHNVGLGVTRDPNLLKRIGQATALEARATGIPYVFAPCVAVCRDPRWGRCYESYSEDTVIVKQMTEIIPGLQGDIPKKTRKGVPYVAGGRNVAACAKHYVGDGGTHNGINENNTIIDFRGLLKIHMPPYYDAIAKGVSTIMVSYSSWNGVKMHANRFLVTHFLKNKLRFRIMIPYNYPEFATDLTNLVENKAIPISRINDAVRRILRVKFTMGLFEKPYADDSLADQIGAEEHRELAREAVRKSLVLLKNGKLPIKPILPLPKKSNKILVAGTHADNLGFQCGGWTISWQGESGNNITAGITILNAIKSTVDPATKVVFSNHPRAADVRSGKYDYAIVVVGERPYAETAGDNTNLTIPAPGPSIIKNVCKNVKCVVVLISGRPLVIQPYIGMIDAFVAAWLPGTEGQGVADVLYGNYGFTGKLARTWFKSVDQLPMNVGDKHYDPLFPFGFGLTTEPRK